MKKTNYILMAALASLFSVLWLILANIIDFLGSRINELTMLIVFAMVAICIVLLFSKEHIKRKDISASRKVGRIALTWVLLLALMMGVFYIAIFLLLSFFH